MKENTYSNSYLGTQEAQDKMRPFFKREYPSIYRCTKSLFGLNGMRPGFVIKGLYITASNIIAEYMYKNQEYFEIKFDKQGRPLYDQSEETIIKFVSKRDDVMRDIGFHLMGEQIERAQKEIASFGGADKAPVDLRAYDKEFDVDGTAGLS